MFIGLYGKLHVGKDTVASFISEELDNTIQYQFALPIKKIAMIFGFTEEQLYDQEKKEIVDEYWGVSPRFFCQLVGTELFRQGFREDVWIKNAQMFLNKNKDKNIIFSDVRFDNEAEFILKNGGIIIEIKRKIDEKVADSVHAHSSEQGINKDFIIHTINNDGSLEELKEKVSKIIKNEKRFNFL